MSLITECALENGTCVNIGWVYASTDPCKSYRCIGDTSNPSAVVMNLITTIGLPFY